MRLRLLESGSIDIEQQGGQLIIQFNCNCDEALPFCRAMCCKMRPMFTAQLTDDEASKLQHKVTKINGQELKVLPENPNHSGNCFYLENDSCMIHDVKPDACERWHCSPRGNPEDSSITERGNGWVLFPMKNLFK